MTKIKAILLVAMLSALGGCVFPFGTSSGPDDNRSAYFSNDGAHYDNPKASEELQDAPGGENN